ncbi:MAG: hypothetical protein KAR17_15900 [Cyclobacteriaceae bacterium]|nr:hypothetical protein [Cyclobacteriaceae bacterium]
MKSFFNLYILATMVYSLLMIGCAASKVKVTPYVGNWHYIAQTQDGELAVTMTISEIENGYSGFLTSDLGSVDLEGLVIIDGKLIAKFNIEGYELSMEGQFDGDIYTGTTNYDGNEWPMNATRSQEIEQ